MTAPSTSVTELLDWLDQQAEAFSGATNREYYLNYAGLKNDLSLAPIFERHAHLFRRETVERVVSAVADDARFASLREFVVDGYLEQAVKELTEEIAARETADTVTWEGEQLPYRAVQQRVMNEPDTARRHELDERRQEVTAGQNPLRERRWEALYAQTRELGFNSYVGLCDELGGLGLQRLREIMERFLQETEQAYRSRLERELREIGVEPARAERSDLLRLMRSPQFDAAFPRERMLPALESTLQALGVDVAQQPNVHLDAEERPRKSPRAFCAPVEISPRAISSAVRPPSRTASWWSRSVRVIRYRSSSGNCIV